MPKETERQRVERLRLYQAYQESGASVREFASERGISYWRVKSLIKRTEAEGAARPFEEMALPAIPSEVEVTLTNGRSLRIRGDLSERRLERLVRVLEAC